MTLFLVYSTSGITSGKKSLSQVQNRGHFENIAILNTTSIWHQTWKDRRKLCQKSIFHHDDIFYNITGWPQSQPSISFINDITFFMITKNQHGFHHETSPASVSWDYDYIYINLYSWCHWWGHKIDVSPSICQLEHDQKLKISEMLMAILLVYSTSRMTPSKKFVLTSKWQPFWKFLTIQHSFNLTSDV